MFWYIALEGLCHTHLLARAAVGGREEEIVKVGKEEAAKYHITFARAQGLTDYDHSSYLSLGQPMSGWFSAKPLFDRIAVDTNESYLA